MRWRNLGAPLTLLLAISAATLVAAQPAEARGTNITLNTVGNRLVGQSFSLKGNLSGAGWKHNKTITMQSRRSDGTWANGASLYHRADGRYSFGTRTFNTAGTHYYRSVVKRYGHLLDVSPRIKVVYSKPSAPAPNSAWLPDLQVKKLTICSATEQAEATANNGANCFYIVHTNPGQENDVKMLKFASVTVNAGTGRLEVRSTRDNAQDKTASWHDTKTVQRIYRPDGTFLDRDITASTDFYWEQLPSGASDNHGHSHWHIKDFDSYQVFHESTAQEKHGFCFEDNASFRGAGPARYLGSDAGGHTCGYQDLNAEPNLCTPDYGPCATHIVHGLSPMWGDTYPSSLGDQGIDITGLDNECSTADPGVMGPCEITVIVAADGTFNQTTRTVTGGKILESDESNNFASVDLSYQNDQVLSVTAIKGFQP